MCFICDMLAPKCALGRLPPSLHDDYCAYPCDPNDETDLIALWEEFSPPPPPRSATAQSASEGEVQPKSESRSEGEVPGEVLPALPSSVPSEGEVRASEGELTGGIALPGRRAPPPAALAAPPPAGPAPLPSAGRVAPPLDMPSDGEIARSDGEL